AISVAALVRETSRADATKRSSRCPLCSSLTVNSLMANSLMANSLMIASRHHSRSSAILLKQHPCQQYCAGAHRDIGNVERGPAMRSYANIDKVNHTAARTKPVDEITNRARAN